MSSSSAHSTPQSSPPSHGLLEKPPPAPSPLTVGTPPPRTSRPRATSTYVDSPLSIFPLTIPAWSSEASSAALKNNQAVLANIGKIISAFCPLLDVSNIDDLNIKQLGGGLSNTLYLVEGTQEGAATMVLVRVHSEEVS